MSRQAAALGIPLHRDVTYACVEGPRLGARVVSLFLQRAGCDLLGMTNVPEVFLAREEQVGYAAIGIVTHDDCWLEEPAQHVTVNARSSRVMARVWPAAPTEACGRRP